MIEQSGLFVCTDLAFCTPGKTTLYGLCEVCFLWFYGFLFSVCGSLIMTKYTAVATGAHEPQLTTGISTNGQRVVCGGASTLIPAQKLARRKGGRNALVGLGFYPVAGRHSSGE